jgi:hypothetical protein
VANKYEQATETTDIKQVNFLLKGGWEIINTHVIEKTFSNKTMNQFWKANVVVYILGFPRQTG